jgi:large subunit ribosomal protein L21e
MTTRVGGMRRKTRFKLARKMREKGKVPITAYLQKFENGAKVQFVANSFLQTGMGHPRYHGKVGVVIGSQGGCYKVDIMDGNKKKTMIVHPTHLKTVN